MGNMLGSKSSFFNQTPRTLQRKRKYVIELLNLKGRSLNEINHYVTAYDFFCKFTNKFDGATTVKDLHDIPNLDLDAMVHDYECLIGANRNYKLWYASAWNYYENMRKQGKGNQVVRLLKLWVVGIIFVPYCYLLTPKY